MASATTTITPNVLTTLGFEKISQGISWYQPDEVPPTHDSSGSPTLIIICSWAFAQPKHIAKYIQPHKEIYPNASILLVQNIISNAVWRPDSWQMSFFQPAATKIQAHLSATTDPRVLMHAFSNGGSHGAVQLSQACRETCGGMRLLVDALVLDSCPAPPRFSPSVAALISGIPSKNYAIRGLGTVLAYASVAMTGAFDILNISEHALWKLYRVLNDPNDVFLLKTLSKEQGTSRVVPRTYLYSKSDTMIPWEDVVAHARIAKEKLIAEGLGEDEVEGFVCLEEFHGTAHVNHIKEHGTRYWNAIKDTWGKAERLRTLPN